MNKNLRESEFEDCRKELDKAKKKIIDLENQLNTFNIENNEKIDLNKFPFLAWSVDKDLKFTAAFGANADTTGLRGNNPTGRTLYDFFQTNDKNSLPIRKHLQALQGEHISYTMHYFGFTHYIQLIPIRNEANKIVGVAGVSLNISELSGPDEEKIANEQLFKSILDASPDGISVTDLKGNVKFIGGKTLELFGYSDIDKIIGRNTLEFIHESDHEIAILNMQAAMRGEPKPNYTYRLIRKDGSTFYAEINARQHFDDDGNVIGMVSVIRDATNKIRQDKDFKELLKNNRDGWVATTMNGTILDCNLAFEQIVEYSVDELKERTFFDITPEKWQAVDNKFIYSQARKTGFTEVYEKEFIAKSGKIVPVELRITMNKRDGQNVGMWLFIRDISDKKKTAKMLAQSQEQYKTLVEQLDVGIVVIFKGLIDFINPALADMVGKPIEEIHGTNFINYIHPDEKEIVYNRVVGRLQGKDVESVYDTIFLNDKEEKVYVQIDARIIEYKDSKAGLAFITNITTRKIAEIKLRESEEQFRSLVQNVPVGIIVHDTDGNIINANSRASEILFLETDNLKSRVAIDKNWQLEREDGTVIPPEEYPFSLVMKNKKPIENYITKLTVKDILKYRWILINSYPQINEEGEIHRVLIAFTDITNEIESNIKLKETNQSLKDMIYIASHDLQTPLVSMEGYSTELLENYKDKLDDEGQYCITRLRANARRMHNLVISLLNLSRLNTVKYPFEKFNPQKIIARIINELELKIKEENIKINLQDMPEIVADKERITSVFRNLITNAMNYGGKTIDIGCQNNTFFIKDDGIGIPSDQLERIFKPGERLKLNDTPGAGMGLTFCEKVILKHNGSIWAESEGMGKGSTFYFKLSN